MLNRGQAQGNSLPSTENRLYGCCFSFTWPTESIIGIVVDNIRGAIKIIKTVQRKLREHQIVNDSIVEQRDQQPSLNGSYCLIVSAENKPLIITFNSLQRRREKKTFNHVCSPAPSPWRGSCYVTGLSAPSPPFFFFLATDDKSLCSDKASPVERMIPLRGTSWYERGINVINPRALLLFDTGA